LEESQMFPRYVFTTLASVVLLTSATLVASGQTGELRGHANIKQANGQTVPAADAAIDVYRTDLSGKYNTKTNKKGEFVFAGLPYVGTYIIASSHPAAQPTFVPNVKVGREVDYELSMSPGDGKRLTLEQINGAMAAPSGGGGPAPGGTKDNAESRAKREELMRKNAEILEMNKKIEEANSILARTSKAGNEAFLAKNYDEAIKQYDEGLAADAEQPALLMNKALALKARGVDRYNAAVTSKDDAAKTSGLEAAKTDFRAAADSTAKATTLIKAQPVPTEPAEQAKYNASKLATLSTHAETMRLFVTKADPTQVEAGQTAFEEYIAAETDAEKKAKAQHDLAQMLFDAGAGDKALVEFKKILATNPDDPDANLGAGLALYGIGDKSKYQDAANYLQHFVDVAPDSHKFKADAKDILAYFKSTEKIEAVKTPARAGGRRKP
jgi:tetratricopeptide (TPR) repeat protein